MGTTSALANPDAQVWRMLRLSPGSHEVSPHKERNIEDARESRVTPQRDARELAAGLL
jgi:hypothetical protein